MNRSIASLLCLLTIGCSVAQAQGVDAPEAQPVRTVVITAPPPTQPPIEVTHDERLALAPLEPYVVAIQRDQYGLCGEWRDEALAVGWLPEEWRQLRRIIARETGNTCDPTVINDNADTGDLSYGLTQINMRGRLGPDRVSRCALATYEDLWDGKTNLRCARVLYLLAGWEPWAYVPR